MKKHKNLIALLLLTLSTLTNNAIKSKSNNDADWGAFSEIDDTEDISRSGVDKTPLAVIGLSVVALGGIIHCMSNRDNQSKIPEENRIPKPNTPPSFVNRQNPSSTSERRLLFRSEFDNGVSFSVYFGDICEWQGEGPKGNYAILSPDNSNLNCNGGLAEVISKKFGGSTGHYKDEANLMGKLHNGVLPPGQCVMSDPVPLNDVMVGVCHSVAYDNQQNAGKPLPNDAKEVLEFSYLNPIITVMNACDKKGKLLYSAINMCTMGDSIFENPSPESASVLGNALVKIANSQWTSDGLKEINLVIHSGFNDAKYPPPGTPKRSDVFINTIKQKLETENKNGNRIKSIIDYRSS